MVQQLIYNVGMAFIWTFLSGSGSPSSFLFGYALGAFSLFLFYAHEKRMFYLKRVWKALVLLIVFCKEVVIANLSVLRYVVSPLDRMNPGIVAINVDFDTDFELVLLANMITLTPGTLTLEISQDNRTLFLHTLDCSEPEKLIAHINSKFVRRIKEVSKA